MFYVCDMVMNQVKIIVFNDSVIFVVKMCDYKWLVIIVNKL